MESEVDILDILAEETDSVAPGLVDAVIADSTARGRRRVNMWLPVRDPLHGTLERMGFRNGLPVTYIGGRMLDRSANGTAADMFDVRAWHYAMGDSDVF
jgi:hypothetical protein